MGVSSDNKNKSVSFIFKYFILIFSVFICYSCTSEKKQNGETSIEPVKKITDFYNFKHYIDNQYAYDISIKNIEVKKEKGAFSITKEKYGIPEYIDGQKIQIEFTITNPYSKSMRAPFPEYFEISAKEFDGLTDFIYSKSCRCHISNSTTITNKQGLPLSSFSKYSEDMVGRKLLVDFKPNESKSIIIKFDTAFPENIKNITIIGFNKHLHKEVDDFYSLTEEEQKKSLADKSSSYGLNIDLSVNKITSISEYKRL